MECRRDLRAMSKAMGAASSDRPPVTAPHTFSDRRSHAETAVLSLPWTGIESGLHPSPYFGRSRVRETTESGIREDLATLLGA